MDEWLNYTHTHTRAHTHHTYNGILFSYKREGRKYCKNMDEPGRYYAKWNKSDKEGQKLHGVIYM